MEDKMFKKSAILLFILAFGVVFSTTSFAQDVVSGEEKDTVEVTDEPAAATESDEAVSTEESSGTATESPAVTTDAPVDETTATDDATTTTGDAAATVEVTPEVRTMAEKAKTHYDGVNTFVNSKVRFKLSISDNFLPEKIFYQINGGQEIEYKGEFNLSEEGKHAITYYGVDKIGNKEYQKTLNTIVDNTAPQVSVSSKDPLVLINNVYYTSKLNTFTINAFDALSGVNNVAYSTSGTEFVNYVTTFNFYIDGQAELKLTTEDYVTNKTSLFKIKLPDAQGNLTSQEVGSVKIFVDNTAPAVTIKADKEFYSDKGRKVASRDFKYTVNATDNEAGIKKVLVRVDGKGAFVPYEGEIEFQTNGEHFIEAMAVDKVGNVSNTIILPLYVDIIPPKSILVPVTE
jgi:hypothetical protein